MVFGVSQQDFFENFGVRSLLALNSKGKTNGLFFFFSFFFFLRTHPASCRGHKAAKKKMEELAQCEKERQWERAVDEFVLQKHYKAKLMFEQLPGQARFRLHDYCDKRYKGQLVHESVRSAYGGGKTLVISWLEAGIGAESRAESESEPKSGAEPEPKSRAERESESESKSRAEREPPESEGALSFPRNEEELQAFIKYSRVPILPWLPYWETVYNRLEPFCPTLRENWTDWVQLRSCLQKPIRQHLLTFQNILIRDLLRFQKQVGEQAAKLRDPVPQQSSVAFYFSASNYPTFISIDVVAANFSALTHLVFNKPQTWKEFLTASYGPISPFVWKSKQLREVVFGSAGLTKPLMRLVRVCWIEPLLFEIQKFFPVVHHSDDEIVIGLSLSSACAGAVTSLHALLTRLKIPARIHVFKSLAFCPHPIRAIQTVYSSDNKSLEGRVTRFVVSPGTIFSVNKHILQFIKAYVHKPCDLVDLAFVDCQHLAFYESSILK